MEINRKIKNFFEEFKRQPVNKILLIIFILIVLISFFSFVLPYFVLTNDIYEILEIIKGNKISAIIVLIFNIVLKVLCLNGMFIDIAIGIIYMNLFGVSGIIINILSIIISDFFGGNFQLPY